MDRYTDKRKRAMRRHNHIARDLRTPKYKKRVVPDKKNVDDYEHWTRMDWLKHLDEDNDIEE